MTSAVVLNEDDKWEHYTPTSGVSGGKPLADHAEVDALHRQLREVEAQREAGAQEIHCLHREVSKRDERIAALEAELGAIQHAAHMPTDYPHGLPSWINQLREAREGLIRDWIDSNEAAMQAEEERARARRAAAAFYRYIMATAAVHSHCDCGSCENNGACDEMVGLQKQQDEAFAAAMEAAKDFTP